MHQRRAFSGNGWISLYFLILSSSLSEATIASLTVSLWIQYQPLGTPGDTQDKAKRLLAGQTFADLKIQLMGPEMQPGQLQPWPGHPSEPGPFIAWGGGPSYGSEPRTQC